VTVAFVRTFVAIPLPGEIREAVREFEGRIAPWCGNVRWERTDKLHLTMKFLGDTDERIVPEVLRAVGDAAAGIAPFTVTVAGFGAFPSEHRPRILWLGCGDAGGQLGALNRGLGERLASLGFGPENRPFHPHVTIARVRDEGVSPHLTSLPKNINFDAHHTLVTELFLMKSVLQPAGSEYTVIGSSILS
jgi:RNA 2',3'-cyclic 3'-phosphodiesterase